MEQIDTSTWLTQKALAKELNVTIQCVHNWIKRQRIESLYIKELDITLVNKYTITARHINK